MIQQLPTLPGQVRVLITETCVDCYRNNGPNARMQSVTHKSLRRVNLEQCEGHQKADNRLLEERLWIPWRNRLPLPQKQHHFIWLSNKEVQSLSEAKKNGKKELSEV